MVRRAAALFLIAAATASLAAQPAPEAPKPAVDTSALAAALAAPTRTPANVARDNIATLRKR